MCEREDRKRESKLRERHSESERVRARERACIGRMWLPPAYPFSSDEPLSSLSRTLSLSPSLVLTAPVSGISVGVHARLGQHSVLVSTATSPRVTMAGARVISTMEIWGASAPS